MLSPWRGRQPRGQAAAGPHAGPGAGPHGHARARSGPPAGQPPAPRAAAAARHGASPLPSRTCLWPPPFSATWHWAHLVLKIFSPRARSEKHVWSRESEEGGEGAGRLYCPPSPSCGGRAAARAIEGGGGRFRSPPQRSAPGHAHFLPPRTWPVRLTMALADRAGHREARAHRVACAKKENENEERTAARDHVSAPLSSSLPHVYARCKASVTHR